MSSRKSLLAAFAALLLLAPFAGPSRGDGSEPTPRRFTRVGAPDGIQIRRYNKTTGKKPGKKDRVVVNYRGTLADGSVFEKSRSGSPSPFRMDKAIPCWQEALTRLRVGEKAQVICPPKQAYGAKGAPPDVPPGAWLSFEIELVGIQ